MKSLKQIFYLSYEIIIVYYIYSISVLLLKIGFIQISRNIYFAFIVMFLLMPLLKTYKISRGTKITELQNDVKINNSIKKLKNINRLDNPVLKYKKDKYNLDSLIITDKGVFNIVEFNLKGKVKIENDYEWFIKSGKEYKGVKSPIIKIKKYRKILRTVFNEDIIYDVIVLMEDRVSVDGEENSKVNIVRYNELDKFINEYDSKEQYDNDELYDKLYPIIYSNKDNSKEMSIYEKYLDNKWKYRGRLAVILISFVFYIEKIVYVLK